MVQVPIGIAEWAIVSIVIESDPNRVRDWGL